MVSEGEAAPDFTLTSDAGEPVRLSDFRGKPVVLYFYPKDDTPGCTTQARGIRDSYAEFERTGAVVLGISPDDAADHMKFREKYDLPFTLLADTEHEVAERLPRVDGLGLHLRALERDGRVHRELRALIQRRGLAPLLLDLGEPRAQRDELIAGELAARHVEVVQV